VTSLREMWTYVAPGLARAPFDCAGRRHLSEVRMVRAD